MFQRRMRRPYSSLIAIFFTVIVSLYMSMNQDSHFTEDYLVSYKKLTIILSTLAYNQRSSAIFNTLKYRLLMLLKETLPINSLKKTADACSKNSNQYTSSTMGVLIDVTGSVYRERDKDYITQLKIVDQTINDEQVYSIMVKYCSVFVFSPTDFAAHFCNQIGQIIYLENFIFSVWHCIKLETRYLSRTQKLCCYEVSTNNIELKGIISSNDNTEPNQPSVASRAKQLRQWFSTYYFSSYRPILGIPLMNNYTLMADPFCMILKHAEKLEILPTIEREGPLLELLRQYEDSNGNHFFIRKSTLRGEFPKSKYVFLRGVKCLGNFFEIMLTIPGNIIGLPDQFAAQYRHAMNYCAVSRFSQRFLLKNHKPCLLSKISFVALKTTPIEELLKECDHYSGRTSRGEEVRTEDYCMIEAVAINFQGQLHMFHTEHQIIIDNEFLENFSPDQKKEMIELNKISYLYEGYIGVIDRSSEKTGKLFYVHLFSNQMRTQFYDNSIIDELVKNTGRDLNKMKLNLVKKTIQQKLQNLVDKSTFSNTISMLLQPIKAETLIYRLTNTVFE